MLVKSLVTENSAMDLMFLLEICPYGQTFKQGGGTAHRTLASAFARGDVALNFLYTRVSGLGTENRKFPKKRILICLTSSLN